MNIVLVKKEKALSVNSEFYKSTQPFAESVENLLFKFDMSSSFSSVTY